MHYPLQQKSAAQEPNSSASYFRVSIGRLFGGYDASNQESEASADAAAGKSGGVLGQKQQWRKHRAQRQRQPQTVSSMTFDGEDPDDLESARSQHQDGSADRCQDASGAFAASQRSMASPPVSSRSVSSASRSSDALDTSRSSSLDSEKQRFIITRQKRATFSAKLHLPGQKPLYLGRYKSEEAAQAACERAVCVILTPRRADTQ